MTPYYLPVALIIASNVLYNICAKSMPTKANPFFCLVITYLVAAAFAFVLFVTQSSAKNAIASELRLLNWAPLLLGLSIVVLEFGYILLYRAGWNISMGSLVCNILLALLLLFIGLLFYHESLSARQIFGLLLCLGGLFFLNR